MNEAIHIIGQTGYEPAAAVLIGYLDFRNPEAATVPRAVRHAGPTNDLYPAADALEAIGAPAIPYLKNAMSINGETSNTSRVNAASVFFLLAKEKPQAIKFIVEKAHSIDDRIAARALTEAAEKITKRSAPKDRDSCIAALQTQ